MKLFITGISGLLGLNVALVARERVEVRAPSEGWDSAHRLAFVVPTRNRPADLRRMLRSVEAHAEDVTLEPAPDAGGGVSLDLLTQGP